MRPLRIIIHRDNAAFEPSVAHETARLLRVLAHKIESGNIDLANGYGMVDGNGATVGRAQEVDA
jgi:hypothetical protein